MLGVGHFSWFPQHWLHFVWKPENALIPKY
jgi:hypothetical protein